MEDWELDFEWLRVRHKIQSIFGKEQLPDLNSILFLIGIQELGYWPQNKFTKEEKQELMHVAVCTLMSLEGYYEFEGRDTEGWPHYRKSRILPSMEIDEQEKLLKRLIIRYFIEEKFITEEE